VCQMILLEPRGFGRWVSFQPSQAPLGLILSRLGVHESLDGFRDLIKTLPGFVAQFSLLQQDPDYSCLKGISSSGDVEVLDYIVTARLPLNGTYDEYWRGRSSNLRHNVERQIRRLGEQEKSLTLAILTTPEHMADGLREHAGLESQGWKAGTFTAITETNAQGIFYTEMLRHFATRGEAVIYQLQLDGKTIASDLCLRRNRMLVVLKTAYDEGIQGLSPALLMRRNILQTLFQEREVDVVEFYGRVMEWHTKWTRDFRTIFHLNLYHNMFVRQSANFIKLSWERMTGLLRRSAPQKVNSLSPAAANKSAVG